MTARFNRRTLLLAAPALALCQPALAAARPYKVDADNAEITFLFDLSGITQTGTAPLRQANLSLDPNNLTASTADVTADLTRARTGLIFATEALKSRSVLDTDTYPFARFRSTKVTLGRDGRLSNGATLAGKLTLRGVTQPIRFAASLFRPQGSAADDLSRLDIRLRGTISRAAFGATGYADLVADPVGLDITAKIEAI